jgi:hypothetical protein
MKNPSDSVLLRAFRGCSSRDDVVRLFRIIENPSQEVINQASEKYPGIIFDIKDKSKIT